MLCGSARGEAPLRQRGGDNTRCDALHLITAFGGADTIRHCHEVNKSSLHSVPHWNYIHLYLPKGSGGFRFPSRGSLLGCLTASSFPRRRSGVSSRSFFPQKKRRHPNAPRTTAAVRGAQLRGFAKQTEKGAWKPGASLLAQRIPTPFSTNCRDKGNSHLPIQTQVLWYFLDSRKYRFPRPPHPHQKVPRYLHKYRGTFFCFWLILP